jgi:hypothetical protein
MRDPPVRVPSRALCRPFSARGAGARGGRARRERRPASQTSRTSPPSRRPPRASPLGAARRVPPRAVRSAARARGPFFAPIDLIDYVKVTADATRANGALRVRTRLFARASPAGPARPRSDRARAPLAPPDLGPTNARAPLTFGNLRAPPSPSSSSHRPAPKRSRIIKKQAKSVFKPNFTGEAGKPRSAVRESPNRVAIGFSVSPRKVWETKGAGAYL